MKKSIILAVLLGFLTKNLQSQFAINGIKLNPGDEFTTETLINQNIEQEFMGIRYSTQMNTLTICEMKVKSLTDENEYMLTTRFNKIKITISGYLINIELSTEETNKKDTITNLLKQLLNKDFTIYMDPKGVIREISGLNDMIKSVISSSKLNEERKNEFYINLVQSIGDEAFKDNFNTFPVGYPESEVKPGSEWDSRLSFSKTGIPLTLDAHVNFKGISGGMALIYSTGRIISGKADSILNHNPDENKFIRVNGNDVSEWHIDLKTGLITESIVSQNINGSFQSEEEELSGDTEIPFKISSRTTINTSLIKDR
jgi:hypothetical protein